MKIEVINLNTTASMTQKIGKAACAVVHLGPKLSPALQSPHSPKAQIISTTPLSSVPD